MGNFDTTRVVTCDLAFLIVEPAEVVVQVVAATSAGRVVDRRLDIRTDGLAATSIDELEEPHGGRLHVIRTRPGHLTISYRAELQAGVGAWRPDRPGYERQLYMRPSRYCPSDHLVGFAVAEFGAGTNVTARVEAITHWLRARIGYVPGSSGVHDTAEDTLLTGMGTCRDFAHLGIALCRATGIPARFAAVYAPGLFPMDFHAVFETYQDGRWYVHDATGLAPRPSLVRVATGRDAADTAFATITSGIADLRAVQVSATVGTVLPEDDQLGMVELA